MRESILCIFWANFNFVLILIWRFCSFVSCQLPNINLICYDSKLFPPKWRTQNLNGKPSRGISLFQYILNLDEITIRFQKYFIFCKIISSWWWWVFLFTFLVEVLIFLKWLLQLELNWELHFSSKILPRCREDCNGETEEALVEILTKVNQKITFLNK